MEKNETMATLFTLAINAEKAAQSFYRGLTKKFSYLPEISNFWKKMEEDEKYHARELENIFNSLPPDKLLVPADQPVLWKAKEVSKFSVEDNLDSIKTLEDAYQIANEFENSEINTVFAFLTRKFISSAERKRFVLSELKYHLAKLMGFPQSFGDAEWRKSVVSENP